MRRVGEVVSCVESKRNCTGSAITSSGVNDNLPAIENYTVLVKVSTPSACSRCAKGHGCGSAIFQSPSNSVCLPCRSRWPVKARQRVTVSVDEPVADWLWLPAATVGLPLVGLIAGAVLGTLLMPFIDGQGIYVQNVTVGQTQILADSSSAIVDVLTAGFSAIGFIGGLIAWRIVKPRLETWINAGLCLHTARIVAVNDEPLETDG